MKLIKLTPDHYVVVDVQPTGGEYYLDDTNAVRKAVISDPEYWAVRPEYRKITHSTQPIEPVVVDVTPVGSPIEDYVYGQIQPLDLYEVKALTGEVDVEKKAKEEHEQALKRGGSEYAAGYYEGLLDGYNQALEDNKEKKYTEEDMKVAITQAFLSGVERLEDFERVQEMILDNIKPKTEWEVEFVDGKLKLK